MLPRSSPLLALALSTTFLLACGGGSAPPPNTAAGQYAPQSAGVMSYRLPVVGKWRVHRTHYGANNDQAYALDLVLDEDLPGRGRPNSDYPSYNQPVVADGPGIVAVAVDGVPDNPPGVVNKYDMHGNYVVIDHQNGEYSLFAHLVPGSVRVRPGQPVNAGSEIGRCGNSGHSSMTHLHWQVMTNANANMARGIPPRLLPYERNGATSVELPQKGDKLFVR